MQQTPITIEGYEALKAKFKNLTNERKDLIERKEDAYLQGDPAENPEYNNILDELGKLESVMRKYEEIIFSSQVVDSTQFETDMVRFGLSVFLENIENPDDIKLFRIVGTNEVDLTKGYISNISPIGKILLGKVVDDEIDISDVTYVITRISH